MIFIAGQLQKLILGIKCGALCDIYWPTNSTGSVSRDGFWKIIAKFEFLGLCHGTLEQTFLMPKRCWLVAVLI